MFEDLSVNLRVSKESLTFDAYHPSRNSKITGFKGDWQEVRKKFFKYMTCKVTMTFVYLSKPLSLRPPKTSKLATLATTYSEAFHLQSSS